MDEYETCQVVYYMLVAGYDQSYARGHIEHVIDGATRLLWEFDWSSGVMHGDAEFEEILRNLHQDNWETVKEDQESWTGLQAQNGKKITVYLRRPKKEWGIS
jgi:hypothetical protein